MPKFSCTQPAAAIKIRLHYGCFLLLCFLLVHCENKMPVNNGKASTFSGSIRLNDGVSIFPLKGAAVVINNKTAKTDSNGAFSFAEISAGNHLLRISHSSVVCIDTTVTIEGDTQSNFVFRMFHFEGTIYRLLLAHEQVPDPGVPAFFRVRAVIGATMTLDEKHTKQTRPNPGSCNNFDFGLVQAGRHRLQITAPNTQAVDTVVVINHKSGCFLEAEAYHFTLPTIAPPQREFVFPLLPRSSWRYRYSYLRSSPVFNSSYQITGQHTWTIKEMIDNGTEITAFMQAIRTDSIVQSGINFDTTYTQIDTVQFTIRKFADTFVANWPRALIPSRFQTVPRFHFYGSDTLELRTNIADTPVGGGITYISGIGMVSCSASQSSNSFTSESYLLAEYKKE